MCSKIKRMGGMELYCEGHTLYEKVLLYQLQVDCEKLEMYFAEARAITKNGSLKTTSQECCKTCVQLCPTLCGPMDSQPTRLFCLWDFRGKNTAVGCHFLLQGIFLTQGQNPCLLCLLHWQEDSLPLQPPGEPK